jgi:hypothetical protein
MFIAYIYSSTEKKQRSNSLLLLKKTEIKFIAGRRRLLRKPTYNSSRGGDEADWEMEAHLSEFWVFGLHQILEATDNFSEENKLGEGGFGPVYKVNTCIALSITICQLITYVR